MKFQDTSMQGSQEIGGIKTERRKYKPKVMYAPSNFSMFVLFSSQ